MKIYTKTGDKGKTRLVGGTEVEKNNPRIEAYGTVDELNSHIGWIVSNLPGYLEELRPRLQDIQNYLFNLGSHLANEKTENLKHLPPLEEDRIKNLEQQIDEMTKDLPELKSFILPGGSPLSASGHIARTVCRRAERRCVELLIKEPGQEHFSHSVRYLNRLSDYLFTLSRWLNLKLQQTDVVWTKK